METAHDPRIVMTLDAGGTTLKFTAIRGNALLFDPIAIPTEADRLDRCLANITAGFEEVRSRCPAPPVAMSFAFPGPADYPAGIIGDLPNFPAFRGGVALGPMLEEHFKIPVFINNDGSLFAYGEAIAGFLPYVNGLLQEAGSAKRYENLFGVTLGTGFGGGVVVGGRLLVGDNSCGGQAFLLRNKLDPAVMAEEGRRIAAVRRTYASIAGVPLEQVPEPKEICEIGLGHAAGDRTAAVVAFRRLGEVAGDAIAQALTLIDGLVVIGGGISGASDLFLPALVAAMNGCYVEGNGLRRRLVPRGFNIDQPAERAAFLQGETRNLAVPGSGRTVCYDPLPRTAVGLSRMGTSAAVAVGAYAVALQKLDGG